MAGLSGKVVVNLLRKVKSCFRLSSLSVFCNGDSRLAFWKDFVGGFFSVDEWWMQGDRFKGWLEFELNEFENLVSGYVSSVEDKGDYVMFKLFDNYCLKVLKTSKDTLLFLDPVLDAFKKMADAKSLIGVEVFALRSKGFSSIFELFEDMLIPDALDVIYIKGNQGKDGVKSELVMLSPSVALRACLPYSGESFWLTKGMWQLCSALCDFMEKGDDWYGAPRLEVFTDLGIDSIKFADGSFIVAGRRLSSFIDFVEANLERAYKFFGLCKSGYSLSNVDYLRRWIGPSLDESIVMLKIDPKTGQVIDILIDKSRLMLSYEGSQEGIKDAVYYGLGPRYVKYLLDSERVKMIQNGVLWLGKGDMDMVVVLSEMRERGGV